MKAALLCLSLAGCGSMTAAPEGWPELTRTEVLNVGVGEVAKICADTFAPLACAHVDLCTLTCTTYYQSGMYLQFIRDHEDGHCNGSDHVGETTFADLLALWKTGKACPQ